jgi:hypothetical protein
MIGIGVLLAGIGVLWLCFAVGVLSSRVPEGRVCAFNGWKTNAVGVGRVTHEEVSGMAAGDHHPAGHDHHDARDRCLFRDNGDHEFLAWRVPSLGDLKAGSPAITHLWNDALTMSGRP